MSARVSVLMPVFNRPKKMLSDSIKSILGQSYKSIQLIIYNDGSTDDTLSFIPDDPRIRVINASKNRGVGYARNRLLDAANTEFACWQDSDDISHPHRVEKQLRRITSSQSDMVFSYMKFFRHGQAYNRRNASVYKVDVNRYKEKGGITASNMCFATSFFRVDRCSKEKFDIRKRTGEDLDWLIRLSGPPTHAVFDLVPQPLYFCRRHQGRLTYKKIYRRLKKAGESPEDNAWIRSHRPIPKKKK